MKYVNTAYIIQTSLLKQFVTYQNQALIQYQLNKKNLTSKKNYFHFCKHC